MMMRLSSPPLLDALGSAERVLIAGAGGGFDVFAGLPLYFALKAEGRQVHLANLSFTRLEAVKTRPTPTCAEVWCDSASVEPEPYFPERLLCEFLKDRGHEAPIYCFEKSGVPTLRGAYRALVEQHNLDAVVLVDGGTDSLMRGDEAELGTPHEDMLSIAAVSGLSLETKLLVCLGFGVDTFHGVCHAHFLENVAALDREGGFLGALSLLKAMPEVQLYLDAVRYVHEQGHRSSIVNLSIASALEGEYGDVHRTERTRGSKLWINPLMGLYWAFDLAAVAASVQYLPALEDTTSFWDLVRRVGAHLKGRERVRDPEPIPV